MKKIIRTTIVLIAVCMVLSQLDTTVYAVYAKTGTDSKIQKTIIGLSYDVENNSSGSTIAKDSGSDLIDGMYLDGPDRIFAFQGPLILHINKTSWESAEMNDIPFRWSGIQNDLEYKWFADDSSVVSFQNTVNFELVGCLATGYNIKEEKHFFSVKPGITRINCLITDKEGHECTISKQMHIMGGKPIKSLNIGKIKIRNARLYSEWSPLYTNIKNKKVKVKCVPEQGWWVKRIIYVYQDKKGELERDITKSKLWPVNSDESLRIKIELVDTATGQIFTFEVNDSTYKLVRLPVKYKTGSGIAAYIKREGLMPNYVKVIKYKAGASSKDENYYRGRKDLARKMVKYYGMNPEAITIKGENICIKMRNNTYERVIWEYAKNKKELNKKSKIEYWEPKKRK